MSEIADALDEAGELLGRYYAGNVPPTWGRNLGRLGLFAVVHLTAQSPQMTVGELQDELQPFLTAAYHMGAASIDTMEETNES